MRSFLLIYIFILIGSSLYAENENLIYDSPPSVRGEITACYSITLKDGFFFEANATESLFFKTDPSLCAPGIDNPIDVGEHEKDFSFSHTIDTKDLNDNFNGSWGHHTNEVVYKFRLKRSMRVIISLKDSGLDDVTYVCLLNHNKSKILGESDERSADPEDNYAYLDMELEAGEYYVISEGLFVNGEIKTSIEATVFVKSLIDLGSFSSDFEERKSIDTRSNCIDGYFWGKNWGEDHFKDQFYQFYLSEPMLVKIYFDDPDLYPSSLGFAPDPYYYLINPYGEHILVKQDSLKEVLPCGKYTLIVEGLWKDGVIITNIEGTKEVLNPSKDQNYIRTRTYTLDDNKTGLDVIQYYDGLGRLTQTQQYHVTPQKQSLVSVQEYDGLGRESRSWLPAPSSGNGAYVQNPTSIIQSYYNDSAYSRPVYEASPLNRVLEQYGPGKDWYAGTGHSVKSNYMTNTKTGAHSCTLFKVSGEGLSTSFSRSGTYEGGELFVTEVKDEDGNTSYEFKDKLGQVVLTRQMNGSDPHSTYYVYDNFGNLSYVIPPILADELINNGKSTSDTGMEMKHYAYIYKYDDRNRCVWKKLPGCEPIYYVYDKADRLIYSQDGEQRKAGQWSYNLYDDLGRLVVSGYLETRKISHDGLQNAIKDMVIYARRSKRENMDYTEYATNIPYQQESGYFYLPRLANYYDNYDLTEYMDARVVGAPSKYKAHSSAKGLLTMTWEFIYIGEIIDVMYYDERGRMVVRNSLNQMEGIDNEYVTYNFTGQPTKRELIHGEVGGQSQVREEYNYYYDHAGRLIETSHSLDGATPIVLAKNEYDDLGRLKTTQSNNKESLKTSYTYNIRSWINSINTGNSFAESLAYTHSGNISDMEITNDITYASKYTYDGLSRLTHNTTEVLSYNPYEANFNNYYSYDKHGNPMTIWKRYAKEGYGVLDDLLIEYNGNQLKRVEETFDDGYGFMDFADEDVEYTYNANGALLTDKNKGMTIEYDRYNCFKNPSLIQIDNPLTKGSVEYNYSFSGRKLNSGYYWHNKQTSFPMGGSSGSSSGSKWTQYVGNTLYDGYEFEFSLEKILLDNGYIDYKTKKYYFYVRDHLGNNCVVADLDGNVVQRTNYYPFGLPMLNSSGEEVQPYKYNGKEYETIAGINLYDYHARQQDPILGRFTSIDPHAENYFSWSPYSYCVNNPIRVIDPTGMDIHYVDADGNVLISIPDENEIITVSLPEVVVEGKAPATSDFPILLSLPDIIGRLIYPDFLTIGVGFDGVVGVGAGTEANLTWVTRGPESSVLPVVSVTQKVAAGYSVSAGVKAEGGTFLGPSSKIRRGMIETNSAKGAMPTLYTSGSIAAGGKLGISASYTPIEGTGGIVSKGVSFGTAAPAGILPVNGSVGVSNTYVLYDFKK